MKCEIQWIDRSGNPTPDDNEAVGTVYRKRYTSVGSEFVHGAHTFERTRAYAICAKHAKRLAETGMEHWVFASFEEEARQ